MSPYINIHIRIYPQVHVFIFQVLELFMFIFDVGAGTHSLKSYFQVIIICELFSNDSQNFE